MAPEKILVIDDEPDIGWIFSKVLAEEGYQVLVSVDGEEGISKIKKEHPDVVILDLKLPGRDGIEILREIRRFDKDILVIMLTAYETINSAVESMKLGAYDYLSKPINIDKIKSVLENALSTKKLVQAVDVQGKKKRKIDLNSIIGDSLQMQEIHELVEKVAPHDVTVLLRGASGTGKELIARAIHNRSRRADKSFIPIDCAILPDTLVESEIFGHEKGSFTGAAARKLGKFELAQGGTVFLDEIGNLNTHIQVKLLRALQEREIERLGSKKPVKVDVRVITATNINLEKAISTGHFREDLYYRLNVFSISLPLLREREGDVDLLIEYFLKKFNRIFGKKVKGVSTKAKALLNAYPWPGNVRELRNVIESAVILAKDAIMPQHMPLKIQEVRQKSHEFTNSLKKVSKQAKSRAERELILKVLREVNWNKTRASKMLNVDYKTLYNKIKEYDIART